MKMVQKKWLVLIWAGVAIMLVSGCGGDDGGPTDSVIHNNTLMLEFYDTEPLPSPWLFQAWAFKDSAWIAGPAFNVAFIPGKDEMQLLDGQGQPIADNKVTFPSLDLTQCDSLRVTLQQDVAVDTASAGLVFVIAGFIEGNTTAGLECPLLGRVTTGDLYYIHATPTDVDTTNEMSGIWFTKKDLTTPGLDSLPTLPDGWVFEGWGYHDGNYLSTGKFTENNEADHSCRYYNCVAEGALAFPGEDFLIDAPDGLEFPFSFDAGDTVMISFEPENDPVEDKPFLRWYTRPVLSSDHQKETYWIKGHPFPSAEWPNASAAIELD